MALSPASSTTAQRPADEDSFANELRPAAGEQVEIEGLPDARRTEGVRVPQPGRFSGSVLTSEMTDFSAMMAEDDAGRNAVDIPSMNEAAGAEYSSDMVIQALEGRAVGGLLGGEARKHMVRSRLESIGWIYTRCLFKEAGAYEASLAGKCVCNMCSEKASNIVAEACGKFMVESRHIMKNYYDKHVVEGRSCRPGTGHQVDVEQQMRNFDSEEVNSRLAESLAGQGRVMVMKQVCEELKQASGQLTDRIERLKEQVEALDEEGDRAYKALRKTITEEGSTTDFC